LAIAPSYWPRIWPSSTPVELTVHVGESSQLQLPVRSGPETDIEPFGPPETTSVMEVQKLRDASRTLAVRTDLVEGLRSLVNESDTGRNLLVNSLLFFDSTSKDTHTIDELNPSKATTKSERSITVGRGDWETHVETDSIMTADAENNYLQNKLRAFESGKSVL